MLRGREIQWNISLLQHVSPHQVPDPKSARRFQHRWNSSGGGAATRALGPVTSSFMGAAKQHHGGFSKEYQRRPSTARKMFARLRLTLCHLHSEECFPSIVPPPSRCLPQPIWEPAGNQDNYFCPHVKEVLRLQSEAVLLRVLPLHPSIFTFPSLLPPDTRSRRFRISLTIIQSVSFKI